MSEETDRLSTFWHGFADASFNSSFASTPIYLAIVHAVADDQEMLERIVATPATSHWPLPLLASTHYLLLAEPEHPLARIYQGKDDADPVPLFLEFCAERWDEIAELMATRYIQTNECGRTALLGPAFSWVAASTDRPLALIDVGTSAGLTMIAPYYRLDYGRFGATGPVDSPVVIECDVIGNAPPIAETLPSFVSAVGLDRNPLDVTDPDVERWLSACVWPGSPRQPRTLASLELGRLHPPRLVAGDALAGLADLVDETDPEAVVVVTTTWVVGYFDGETRQAFVELLTALSHRRTIVWISGEGQGVISLLDDEVATAQPEETADVLGCVLFCEGEVLPTLLALAHPHGAWIDWRAPAHLDVPAHPTR